MNETTPSPLPPPTVPSIHTGPSESHREAPSGPAGSIGLFLVACLSAIAVAILVGGGIGFVVGTMAEGDCSPNDGWCGLGAWLMGIVTGIVTGGIAYLVTGITIVRRNRPAGRRAGPILALIFAPPLTLATLGFLSELLSSFS